jgi:hypothetical protein
VKIAIQTLYRGTGWGGSSLGGRRYSSVVGQHCDGLARGILRKGVGKRVGIWGGSSAKGGDSHAMCGLPSVVGDDLREDGGRWGAWGSPLWGTRILHQSVQLTTYPLAFGCNLFACFFVKRHHEANEFEGSEQAVVVLVVNKDVVV